MCYRHAYAYLQSTAAHALLYVNVRACTRQTQGSLSVLSHKDEEASVT